jgi:hypothetical protein
MCSVLTGSPSATARLSSAWTIFSSKGLAICRGRMHELDHLPLEVLGVLPGSGDRVHGRESAFHLGLRAGTDTTQSTHVLAGRTVRARSRRQSFAHHNSFTKATSATTFTCSMRSCGSGRPALARPAVEHVARAARVRPVVAHALPEQARADQDGTQSLRLSQHLLGAPGGSPCAAASYSGARAS